MPQIEDLINIIDKITIYNQNLKALSKTVYTYKDDQKLFHEFTAQVTGRTKSIQQIKAKQQNDANGDAKDEKDKKGKKGGKKKNN